MKQAYSLFIISLITLALIFSFNFVVADKYKDEKNNNGLGNIGLSSSITNGNSSNNDTDSDENNSNNTNSSNGGSSGGGGSNGGGGGGSSGSSGVQNTGTVICHIPPGNPAAAHTITVGGKAPIAHLAHGYHLGACGGEVLENDDTNQTDVNLTLSIISPQNITYNMTEILINISSNGDNIWYSLDGGNNITYNGTIIGNFSEGQHTLNAFANDTDEELSASITFNVNLTISGNETNSTS